MKINEVLYIMKGSYFGFAFLFPFAMGVNSQRKEFPPLTANSFLLE